MGIVKNNIEQYLGSGINIFFENVLGLFDTIKNEYDNMSTRKIQLKCEKKTECNYKDWHGHTQYSSDFKLYGGIL